MVGGHVITDTTIYVLHSTIYVLLYIHREAGGRDSSGGVRVGACRDESAQVLLSLLALLVQKYKY